MTARSLLGYNIKNILYYWKLMLRTWVEIKSRKVNICRPIDEEFTPS